MREEILERLRQEAGAFVSGGQLCNDLGVTRTTIWKQIDALRSLGYHIEAQPRLGYRLIQAPDRLYPWEIDRHLRTQRMGRTVEYHAEIGSTNDRAKALALSGCAEGTLVVGECQMQGRGRRGRGWISPFGAGIFASLVLRPPMAPREAPKMTLLSALAVKDALRAHLGVEAGIKWPNDLEMNDRKVCGILVEMGAEMDAVGYVVVGIGINVNLNVAELPAQLQGSVGSLQAEVGGPVDRAALLGAVLNEFEIGYDRVLAHGFGDVIEATRRSSTTLGRLVRVLAADGEWEGTAVDIDDDGTLVVRTLEGEVRHVHSGEVSIRPRRA